MLLGSENANIRTNDREFRGMKQDSKGVFSEDGQKQNKADDNWNWWFGIPSQIQWPNSKEFTLLADHQ